MKKGIKKFLNFSKTSTSEPEKKISIEVLFKKIFTSYKLQVQINEVPSHKMTEILERNSEGFGYHSFSNKCGSIFSCIGDKSPDKLPPIEGIFYLIYRDEQYMLNNHFRVEFTYKKSNLKDLEFMIDERVIYSLTLSSGEVYYFLIDRLIIKEVVKLINKSSQYKKAVSELIMGAKKTQQGPEEIELDIGSRGDFMIGRLFLPSIIARKPVLTESRFTRIYISSKRDPLDNWTGLCYKITLKLEGESFNLYYLFDLINKENIEQYKTLFYNLLKIIVKNSRQKLSECDVHIEKVAANIINRPEPKEIIGAIRLKYYLKSGNSIVSSSIFVPMEYVSYLINKLTPPWYIDFSMDNLENRLKSFLSLNRELYSQGKLSIVEFSSASEKYSSNPVTNMKLNFIKIHEIFDLISEGERKKIIFDYLYRKGWSAKKMKKLFYYTVSPNFADGPQVVYPMALFNETEFVNSLMNNMKDEWEHNHSVMFEDEMTVMLNHFNLLREMYADEEFDYSIRLKTILNQAFDDYYSQVNKLFEKIKNGQIQPKITEEYLNRVHRFFTDNHYLKRLFYFVPDKLKLYDKILLPGQLELLEKIEMEEPLHLDDWCEEFISFVLR